MQPASSANIFCGPCGWAIVPGLPRRQHSLEFIAEHFDAVEIPDTFREFLRPEITRVWMKKVRRNPDFQFTAKLHQSFTHERLFDAGRIAAFKDGLWPLMRAGKLGCVLMQFPWSFRYTKENRDSFIRLRRTFHEFPLVAEMRHVSWMLDEAIGTFIDYRVGFCNIDQPVYTKAMPPTSFLTTAVGYVRLHGRNAFNWYQDERSPVQAHRYDYLYSGSELAEWQIRIGRISGFADKVFVITNNDAGGKAIVNGLQLRSLLRGGDGTDIPPELLCRYPQQSQGPLFSQYPGRAVA